MFVKKKKWVKTSKDGQKGSKPLKAGHNGSKCVFKKKGGWERVKTGQKNLNKSKQVNMGQNRSKQVLKKSKLFQTDQNGGQRDKNG